MELSDKFKSLLKTTEGAIVLGGLTLTVVSPIFGPKFWAIATAVAYVFVNIPGILTAIKAWWNKTTEKI
jgi:hypothetical protein